MADDCWLPRREMHNCEFNIVPVYVDPKIAEMTLFERIGPIIHKSPHLIKTYNFLRIDKSIQKVKEMINKWKKKIKKD